MTWTQEMIPGQVVHGYVHLRVEEAGGRLDNADSLVVDRDSDEVVLAILQHSYELKAKVLGVHLLGEAVGDRLIGASRDLDGVALASEVAKNLRFSLDLLYQGAADNGDADGRWLIVDHGQTRLGGLAVDELDAEDLRLGKRDGHGDIEVGRLWLVYCLLHLLSLRR
jgi:hypothetical protein